MWRFMTLLPTRLLLCLTIAFAVGPGAESPDWQKAGDRWWDHIKILADDNMEGRETGSASYRRAAEYVVKEFSEYGLKPAGEQGFLQPVKFQVQRVMAAKSSLNLVRGSEKTTLHLGEDALLGARLPQPKSIQAPLVFLGYGLHLAGAGFDDFAGQDVKGKILVIMNGGPSNLSSALKAHARAAQEFWKVVEASGALGVVSIPNPKSMDIPWSRMMTASSQPGMRLADPKLQDTHGPMFTATLNPAHAGFLFEGTGHTLEELYALVNAGKPLPHFAIDAEISAAVVTQTETVESPNIIGVLPGADPKLKSEYVVLSAHLDHVGVGEPINGDKIYNGAMDNASGVATLIETAKSLHQSQAPGKRSVLFVVVCGEEKGLLGSRYFAGHPTVPVKSLVADLNTDMFLPLYPLNYLTVYGLEESTLGDDIRAVAEPMDIHVTADRQPDRNIFIRSDQYNFIRAGVPSIMAGFDALPGSPEEKTRSEWLRQRYHAPSDDLQQPVDLVAAARFNALLLALTERIANAPMRPSWRPDSFFKRFEQ
jgi:Zn-dependent M28 family amino/carboxypeptidase